MSEHHTCATHGPRCLGNTQECSVDALTEREQLPQVVLDSPICTICGNHFLDARFHHAPTGEGLCGLGSSVGSVQSSLTSTTTRKRGAATDAQLTSTSTPVGIAAESSTSEREKFEKWFADLSPSLRMLFSFDSAWAGWQARAAQKD